MLGLSEETREVVFRLMMSAVTMYARVTDEDTCGGSLGMQKNPMDDHKNFKTGWHSQDRMDEQKVHAQ